MSTATDDTVELVALGNPHFTLTECAALAARLQRETRPKSPDVELIVTCGRDVHARATAAGHVAVIEAFGGRFVNDTCWCLIEEPVIPRHVTTIATNSGKYAHYGPAAISQRFRFASLDRLVDAACTGRVDSSPPPWLR